MVEVINNGFKNDKVSVLFYEKTEYRRPYIIVKDLTDRWNEPTSYTKKIRGLSRAWDFIVQIFNKYELQDDLNYHDITKILDEKFNLNVHSYCAMD
jgi:hypothetical protein